MSFAIKVEGLGKKYLIKHQASGRRYVALRDVLSEKAKSLFSNRKSEIVNRKSVEEFWALQDVSFEVKPGEAVGIIGRNGAGKSTLLKLLSRITEPTAGRIRLRGRVASLLEVGTGFHPELTGRENIFLNGAVLGMHRAEIKTKFDEIVAFAEVEKFLDTPVKRYSSGMYMRLAFAVAAHLEPEILIVDEVLAVGDAQFQKKCLGKMQDVAKGGRTVLFVSHNMAAVQRLCQTGILLKNGALDSTDSIDITIQKYNLDSNRASQESLETYVKRSGTGVVRLIDFYIEDGSGQRLSHVESGSDFDLVLKFKCSTPLAGRRVNVGISLHQPDETAICVLYSAHTGQIFEQVPAIGEFRCHVKRLALKEGRYLVAFRVESEGVEADFPKGMFGELHVSGGDFYGFGKTTFDGAAPMLLTADWSVNGLDAKTKFKLI